MKKSLQDQLIKAGLGNKQQARKINTDKKKQAGKSTKKQAQSNGPSDAELARKAQQQADRQRNLDHQTAKQAKAQTLEIEQLLQTNALPTPKRGQQFYYRQGNRIKKLLVARRTAIQLTYGQLGIVKPLDPAATHLVVSEKTVKRLQARQINESILWFNQPQTYAEYLQTEGIDDWDMPSD